MFDVDIIIIIVEKLWLKVLGGGSANNAAYTHARIYYILGKQDNTKSRASTGIYLVLCCAAALLFVVCMCVLLYYSILLILR